VIDEAGARQRLKPPTPARQGSMSRRSRTIVAKMARIPAKQVSSSDKDVLRNLERNLKMVIFGQDRRSKPDLGDQDGALGPGRSRKPIGNFLFAGPTGVGKTEVTASWPCNWASSWCASTCPNTWNRIRCRA
jgi:ATP-dependent Clp protease ATP-binding subunit ClpA